MTFPYDVPPLAPPTISASDKYNTPTSLDGWKSIIPRELSTTTLTWFSEENANNNENIGNFINIYFVLNFLSCAAASCNASTEWCNVLATTNLNSIARSTRVDIYRVGIPGVVNWWQSIIGNPIDQLMSIDKISQLISIGVGQAMTNW